MLLACGLICHADGAGADAEGGENDKSGKASELLQDVVELDDTLALDMRYASTNNLTGKVLYAAPRCLLRRSVARRLARVQARLRKRKLGLLLWDCYRPISVQKRLWDLVRDGRYVARPVFADGVPVRGSKHNRGAAIDVTLVDERGQPLAMPTDHDDFSERARSDYRGGSAAARRNARLLRRMMKAEGFTGIASEWWHFDSPDWRRYPLENTPLETHERARQ